MIQTDAPGSDSLHIHLGVKGISHETEHLIAEHRLSLPTGLEGPICCTRLHPHRQRGACETSGLKQNGANGGFIANDGNYLMIGGSCETSTWQFTLTRVLPSRADNDRQNKKRTHNDHPANHLPEFTLIKCDMVI